MHTTYVHYRQCFEALVLGLWWDMDLQNLLTDKIKSSYIFACICMWNKMTHQHLTSCEYGACECQVKIKLYYIRSLWWILSTNEKVMICFQDSRLALLCWNFFLIKACACYEKFNYSYIILLHLHIK